MHIIYIVCLAYIVLTGAKSTGAKRSRNISVKHNMATVEELKAQLATIKEQLKASRVIKQNSDFFADETGDAMRWKNLSETKRYFEKHMPEVLAAAVAENGRLLTSADFHELLAGKF